MEPLQLETVRGHVWELLAGALVEPDCPLRTPTVATVDSAGAPRARVVVLRAVEVGSGTLAFHTDTRSAKFAALEARRAISWVFYDAQRLLQIRAVGHASLHTDDDIADQAWASTAIGSRVPYMASVPSGQDVDEPEVGVRIRDREHSERGRPYFCVVRCSILEFDVLQLHPHGHRRVIFDAEGERWVAP